jgi:hypothetical protein
MGKIFKEKVAHIKIKHSNNAQYIIGTFRYALNIDPKVANNAAWQYYQTILTAFNTAKTTNATYFDVPIDIYLMDKDSRAGYGEQDTEIVKPISYTRLVASFVSAIIFEEYLI